MFVASALNATCLLSYGLRGRRLQFHRRPSDACALCNAYSRQRDTVGRLMFANKRARNAYRRASPEFNSQMWTERVGNFGDDARTLQTHREAYTTSTRYMPDEETGHRQYNSWVQRERLFCAPLQSPHHINYKHFFHVVCAFVLKFRWFRILSTRYTNVPAYLFSSAVLFAVDVDWTIEDRQLTTWMGTI